MEQECMGEKYYGIIREVEQKGVFKERISGDRDR